MESFSISTVLDDQEKNVLVIPEDCTDKSIFHLVKDGSEFCTLIYTDTKSWQLMETANIKPEEVESLGKKIEEHYF